MYDRGACATQPVGRSSCLAHNDAEPYTSVNGVPIKVEVIGNSTQAKHGRVAFGLVIKVSDLRDAKQNRLHHMTRTSEPRIYRSPSVKRVDGAMLPLNASWRYPGFLHLWTA
jgi:hypothetical protein